MNFCNHYEFFILIILTYNVQCRLMVCYVTYVTYDGLWYVISTDKYFSSFADFPDGLPHFFSPSPYLALLRFCCKSKLCAWWKHIYGYICDSNGEPMVALNISEIGWHAVVYPFCLASGAYANRSWARTMCLITHTLSYHHGDPALKANIGSRSNACLSPFSSTTLIVFPLLLL